MLREFYSGYFAFFIKYAEKYNILVAQTGTYRNNEFFSSVSKIVLHSNNNEFQ